MNDREKRLVELLNEGKSISTIIHNMRFKVKELRQQVGNSKILNRPNLAKELAEYSESISKKAKTIKSELSKLPPAERIEKLIGLLSEGKNIRTILNKGFKLEELRQQVGNSKILNRPNLAKELAECNKKHCKKKQDNANVASEYSETHNFAPIKESLDEFMNQYDFDMTNFSPIATSPLSIHQSSSSYQSEPDNPIAEPSWYVPVQSATEANLSEFQPNVNQPNPLYQSQQPDNPIAENYYQHSESTNEEILDLDFW